MPRKRIEVLVCDRCEQPGAVFTVAYEDGVMEFVLCEKHEGPLRKLRDLKYGTWKPVVRRRTFEKKPV